MTLSTSLWMGDLDSYMDELFISGAFQQLGENVLHVKIIKPKKAGSLSGYAFIEFSNGESANQAMLRLNGKVIPGSNPPRRFKLNPASHGKEHMLLPEFSLFVGDLTSDVDDYRLYNAFARRYRSVRGAKVVLDSNGMSKGYGFVRFSDESDQQRALIEMQHMIGIGRRPIKVSLASPKSLDYASNGRHHDKNARSSESSSSHSSYSSYYPHYPGSYYQSSYSWGGYTYNYNQYYPTAQSQHLDHHDDYGQAYDEDMEALEDPGLEVNINRENREFMESSESFFEALERSRWFTMDHVCSQVPSSVS